ncbi:MAG: cysteine--tRNA ligase, partial [Lacticaseibacillus paracasei]|nr:cysteine--tRNA ligase [Lacticaseibacillus paracasei]
ETRADPQITKPPQTFKERCGTAMHDEINVQNGLTVLFDLAKLLNEYANEETVKSESINDLLNEYDAWLQIFGVVFTDQKNLDADIDALVKARDAARAAKDFAKSDQIRDQLAAQGIILEDTPQGTRWRRQ